MNIRKYQKGFIYDIFLVIFIRFLRHILGFKSDLLSISLKVLLSSEDFVFFVV